MPVDNCKHTFEHLAKGVLPKYLRMLRQSIAQPISSRSLVGFRSATKAALHVAGQSHDFSGCYVFLNRRKPIYVGISRGVIGRIVQHLNGETHYSASLVYRMACKLKSHEMKREQAMKDAKFRRQFFRSQKKLHKMTFGFVPIENDLELYIFEAYAAIKLNTQKWNTFRTH